MIMTRTAHPALIAFTALVFLFLLAPLVIIIGAAFSDTTYLTFPPQGLTCTGSRTSSGSRPSARRQSPAWSSPSSERRCRC